VAVDVDPILDLALDARSEGCRDRHRRRRTSTMESTATARSTATAPVKVDVNVNVSLLRGRERRPGGGAMTAMHGRNSVGTIAARCASPGELRSRQRVSGVASPCRRAASSGGEAL
jgi:hypothetical protein